MKKLFITIAILTGMILSASAQFYRGAIYQRDSFRDETQPLGDYLEQRFRESDLYNYFYENTMLYQYQGFLSEEVLGESEAYESNLFQNNYGGGGALQRGKSTLFSDRNTNIYGGLALPNMHGLDGDQDGQDGPLGSGIAVLAALGGAYLLRKRKKE